MFNYRWIHPDYRDLAADHQLGEIESVLLRQDGRPVTPAHRTRDTLRLELPSPNHQAGVYYLKRESAVRWKYVLRRMLTGRGVLTPARAEFEVLTRLAAAGVSCPLPIVCLQRVGIRPRGCLLLKALPENSSLSALLAGPMRDQDAPRRERIFSSIGHAVARLHDSGTHHGQLYANHILLAANEDEWLVSFLGFRRSTLSDRLSLAKRVHDLAALMATLPRRLADSKDRHAFLDAYLEHSGLEDRGMQVADAVARRAEHLLTFRKIWEIRESDTDEHRAVQPMESLQTGKMWIDRRYREPLKGSEIATFESMMETTDGRLLRALRDRENWRIEVHGPHGHLRGAYLKKHHVRAWTTWLRAKVGAGPGETAGRIEAQNVSRLSRSGIAAMQLIAYGEKLHGNGLLESFVLTEELVGFTQLDHFLVKRFSKLDRKRATSRDRVLMTLIQEVALVAAKFHKLGYNHRDLYCCHFFIKEPRTGDFKVNLIDLQRVEHRRHLRSRWLVKDIAQLGYSASRDHISRTHRMAFIKRYLGVKKLRPEDKRFIRRVLSKQRSMERNLGIPA